MQPGNVSEALPEGVFLHLLYSLVLAGAAGSWVASFIKVTLGPEKPKITVQFPLGCPQGSSNGRRPSSPRGASSGICRCRVARVGLVDVPQQGHRAWG